MKRNLLFVVFMLIIIGVNSQNQKYTNITLATNKGPSIKFDSTIYDFGEIPYMSNGSHVFIFTNKGDEPLIITNCIKGCGCTSVNWTNEPILPGYKGMVVTVYNTRNVGSFSRGIDVYSNDIKNPKVNLRLNGVVKSTSFK